MSKSAPTNGKTPRELIDERVASFGDWRGTTLAALRAIITGADAGVVEEWKWGGPVWSCQGIICTGETYKSVVKLTFAKGASVPDPKGVFNSSLEGHTRRALDVREGERIDAKALRALVLRAIAVNASGAVPLTMRPAKAAKAPVKASAARSMVRRPARRSSR